MLAQLGRQSLNDVLRAWILRTHRSVNRLEADWHSARDHVGFLERGAYRRSYGLEYGVWAAVPRLPVRIEVEPGVVRVDVLVAGLHQEIDEGEGTLDERGVHLTGQIRGRGLNGCVIAILRRLPRLLH